MCQSGICVADSRAVYEPNFERVEPKKLLGKIFDRNQQCGLEERNKSFIKVKSSITLVEVMFKNYF